MARVCIRGKGKPLENTTLHFLFALLYQPPPPSPPPPFSTCHSTEVQCTESVSSFVIVVFLDNYVRMTHHFYVIECARTFSHRQQPSKKSFKRKWLFKWYTICIHDSYWYHCISLFICLNISVCVCLSLSHSLCVFVSYFVLTGFLSLAPNSLTRMHTHILYTSNL